MLDAFMYLQWYELGMWSSILLSNGSWLFLRVFMVFRSRQLFALFTAADDGDALESLTLEKDDNLLTDGNIWKGASEDDYRWNEAPFATVPDQLKLLLTECGICPVFYSHDQF